MGSEPPLSKEMLFRDHQNTQYFFENYLLLYSDIRLEKHCQTYQLIEVT